MNHNSRVGGVPELVTHGVDGFLEAPGAIAAQSARVAGLLCDPGLHEKMARAARRTAVTRFCTDHIIPQYERHYQWILKA